MKKIRMLVAVCLVLALCGCSSKEVRSVDALMTAIGEVDTSCGPVVEYVRNAYELLSDKEKSQLKNYELLLAAEASYVDALIDSIGEVTVKSEGAIADAEAAYDALTEDAQVRVQGLKALSKARETFSWVSLRKELSNVWVNEFLGSKNTRIGRGLIQNNGLDETDSAPEILAFELREDMTLWVGDSQMGTWELPDSKTEVILHTVTEEGEQQQVLQITEEGGYTKLLGCAFGNKNFGYVREAEYVDAFAEKYVAAELTKENIHDYVKDPELLGDLQHEDGKSYFAYVYPSAAYEDGLVYLGSSCVLQVDYTHGGTPDYFFLDNPVFSITTLKMKDLKINTESRLSGEIYYVKDAYVADNYIDENGLRVLELTNGSVFTFDGYDDMLDTFWHRVDAEYGDYLY